ncbi:MAG: 3-hydroxyacyl-CoA dehydrogenase NAD-binding domain-containing protein [Candidatus Odinarchaeota archaeon]
MVSIDNIKILTVIGAGTMGREIAQVALMSGFFEKVILNDINKDALEKAVNFIQEGLNKIKNKGQLIQEISIDSLMSTLVKEINLNKSIENADFIVEAIPEVMEVKQELFQNLGRLAPEHTIFASNTSTMSITKIAEASNRPNKVIGMHFFTPVPVLRLIEIIKGEKTSQATFETAIKLAKNLPALKGKRFIAKIEKESPGFIVNRLTIAWGLLLNWLLDLASEKGIPFEKVDNDFVTPPELGPFAKWDYFGIDVVCNTMNYFAKELSPEFTPGKTLTKLLKEGNLGRKTGKGIYEWSEGKPNIKTTEKAELSSPEYYYAIQLNEGCRLLEEGIVSNYKVIDDTMLAGMDVPGPFGPGKNNYVKWTKMLEDLSEKTGLTYLRPCELLRSGEFVKMRR